MKEWLQAAGSLVLWGILGLLVIPLSPLIVFGGLMREAWRDLGGGK